METPYVSVAHPCTLAIGGMNALSHIDTQQSMDYYMAEILSSEQWLCNITKSILGKLVFKMNINLL